MPDLTRQPVQPSKTLAAFTARKEILTALAESQAKEHAFYSSAAAAVGKHMQALCQAWIDLLLNQVLHGGSGTIGRFSIATGIPCNQLNAWCTAQIAHDLAEADHANAKKLLANAEQDRTKFAGTLWGAKKGCEQQYAAADKIVKKTKTELGRQEKHAVETARTLDAVSEALLRECVRKSAVVSASTEFGLDIGRVLSAMQAEAQAMEQQHNQAQQNLLANVASTMTALRSHYQKP